MIRRSTVLVTLVALATSACTAETLEEPETGESEDALVKGCPVGPFEASRTVSVRSCAGMGCGIVTRLDAGERVTIATGASRVGSWYKIVTSSRPALVTGWVFASARPASNLSCVPTPSPARDDCAILADRFSACGSAPPRARLLADCRAQEHDVACGAKVKALDRCLVDLPASCSPPASACASEQKALEQCVAPKP